MNQITRYGTKPNVSYYISEGRTEEIQVPTGIRTTRQTSKNLARIASTEVREEPIFALESDPMARSEPYSP